MPTTADVNRAFVLDMVRKYRNKNHPGLPTTHIPLLVSDALRALLADGTLEDVAVTKPSKVDPAKTMTYHYVRMAR